MCVALLALLASVVYGYADGSIVCMVKSVGTQMSSNTDMLDRVGGHSFTGSVNGDVVTFTITSDVYVNFSGILLHVSSPTNDVAGQWLSFPNNLHYVTVDKNPACTAQGTITHTNTLGVPIGAQFQWRAPCSPNATTYTIESMVVVVNPVRQCEPTLTCVSGIYTLSAPQKLSVTVPAITCTTAAPTSAARPTSLIMGMVVMVMSFLASRSIY